MPAPARVLHIGDPVRLPSGRKSRILLGFDPRCPWLAAEVQGQWAVRRERDPNTLPGYSGSTRATRALARLLTQVGVR